MMENFPHKIVPRLIADLKPYAANARTHSKAQLKQLADSIERFGFTNPVLVSGNREIIAGHGRVMAARNLGWKKVPTLELSHLTAEERRAYVLADNKLAANAGWDQEVLAIELQGLLDIGFDMSVTGFSIADIDLVLDEARESSTTGEPREEDIIPAPEAVTITRPGDVWQLGRHRLICGDARRAEDFNSLMGDDVADIVFTDPPYNVAIDGHVCGSGAIRHREFAMASGEMSSTAFTAFLAQTLGHAAKRCRDGAIAFVCMDWRHLGELVAAGHEAFDELKNVCVWNKTNGGMGTFYRSKHEFVFVFKKGQAPHINNFGLGDKGRYRTNVWDYPGVSSATSRRAEELAMHPTVKPTALVADALRDCSKRGSIVLDPFGGSGTTLIAAQIAGRIARLIEFDPAYCDTIVRRFSTLTGKPGVLVRTGERFDDLAEAAKQAGDVS